VTMVEMLTGTHPWPNLTENLQFFFKLIHLKENEMPEFVLDETACDSLKDFLRLTFILNYKNRPTADELLGHVYLN